MTKRLNVAIEEVPVKKLKVHPRNANQGDFGAIQQSVEENGFYGTLVANKRTGHILAGNHRYKVAVASGFETVPVTWVDVTEEQEIKILLADNRTTRLGLDDEAQLAELLSELAQSSIGLEGTGYDGDDLDDLIKKLSTTNTISKVNDLEDLSWVGMPEFEKEERPRTVILMAETEEEYDELKAMVLHKFGLRWAKQSERICSAWYPFRDKVVTAGARVTLEDE